MEDNKLIYIDEKGNEVLCEILFTFDSEEFKKSYVLFYPVGDENSDEIEVMAASYVQLEDGSVGELHEIETDEEWSLIEETLDQFSDDDDECGCGCEDDDCDCEDGCGCGCDHEHE